MKRWLRDKRRAVYAQWLLACRCYQCDYPVWWHHDGERGSRYLWPHKFERVGYLGALMSALRYGLER